MTHKPKIVIIGSGPTGLGAAWRLNELGYENWKLFEKEEKAGGLASSEIDNQGFVWDYGGHIVFSHYNYFDNVLNNLEVPWLEHARESWIWMCEQFIPYPLQNNLWKLPSQDVIKCIHGLIETVSMNIKESPKNFNEFICQKFGAGLADIFMIPYNKKVWAYNPSELNAVWVGERVSQINIQQVIENMILKKEDISWGPNALFRFPLKNGTGQIWESVRQKLPLSKLFFRKIVTRIDVHKKEIHLDDGTIESYDYLISTMPLNVLISISNLSGLQSLSNQFMFSSSHIVGIGINGQLPDHLKKKCWIYFPESKFPFYRVTVFSNYSPYNVPNPEKQWSLMCEVSESSQKSVNKETLIDDVIAGLLQAKFLINTDQIVSKWKKYFTYGYPTPFLKRDKILSTVDPTLYSYNILSRGRFGAWKYEVSNQDHSFMQGVEAINNILFGTEEITYTFPTIINTKK